MIEGRFAKSVTLGVLLLQLFSSSAYAGFLYLPFSKFYPPSVYVYDSYTLDKGWPTYYNPAFGGGHTGTDYRGDGYDTPIYAAADGTVTAMRETEPDGCDITYSDQLRYGNYVKIDHGNGYLTEYWHLKTNGVVVSTGDKVVKGQLIAYISNSGLTAGSDCLKRPDLPFGACYHLHFEVKKWDGRTWVVVNPYNEWTGWLWATNPPSPSTQVLIRPRGDHPIYFLENGVRRWVPNPITLHVMFPNPVVQDLDPSVVDSIPRGPDIPSVSALIRAHGSPPIYFFENGIRRWVPDPPTLSAIFPGWPIYDLDPGTVASSPQGTNIPSIFFGPYLIRPLNDPPIYFVEDGVRRWVPDPPTHQTLFPNWPVYLVGWDAIRVIPEVPSIPSITVGPQVSASPQIAAQGFDGWHNTDVSVIVSATSSYPLGQLAWQFGPREDWDWQRFQISGNSAVLPPITQDGVYTIHYNVANIYGYWGNEGAITVKLDKTVPSSQISFPEEEEYYNAQSWEAEGSAIRGTAEDNLSGVFGVEVEVGDEVYGEAVVTTDVGSSTEWEYGFTPEQDGTYVARSHALDVAGNRESTAEVTFTYDTTPPATSISYEGPTHEDEQGNQFISPQTSIALEAQDTLSGVEQTSYQIDDQEEQNYEEEFTVEGDDGFHEVQYYSIDIAGNEEEPNTQEVYLDSTPPVSSDDSDGEWHNEDVTVLITAEDPSAPDGTAGSGVKAIYYSGTKEGIAEGDQVVVIFENEGVHELSYFAVDNVENVEGEKHLTLIKIDKTPPEITGAPTTEPNENGWYSENIVIHFEAEDQPGLSGLKSVTLDVVVSTEGRDQEVVGTAEDNAGNTASTAVGGINIDKTDPSSEITFPEEGEYYNAESWERGGGGVIGTTSDNLSGVASVEVEIVGWETAEAQLEDYEEVGTSWEYLLDFAEDGSDDGHYTVRSQATDVAGNQEGTAEVSFTYDTTPPVTSVVEVSGKEGWNGWYKSDVKVTLTVVDSLSPVVKTEYQLDLESEEEWVEGSEITITGDGEHQLFYRSQDAAGNVENRVSYAGNPIKIDTVRPERVEVQDTGDWSTTKQLTFTWSESFDETSGIDHYELWISTDRNEKNAVLGLDGLSVGNATSYTLTEEQASLLSEDVTYYAKVKVYDRAGWVSWTNQYSYSDGIKIDVTPPRVDNFYLVDQSSADQRFTNSADVKLFIEDWDNASGVSSWYVSEDDNSPIASDFTDSRPETFALSDGDGSKLLYVWVRDLAGNISEVALASIILDTAAPFTSANLSGLSGLNNWYVSPVTLTLNSFDETAGIKHIFVAINGADHTILYEDNTGGKGTVLSELPFDEDGTYAVKFWSEDLTGDVEQEQEVVFKIDTTPPAAPTASIPGGTFTEGESLRITLTADDEARIYYSLNSGEFTLYFGSIAITDDITLSAYVVDEAGNRSASVEFNYVFSPVSPVLGIGTVSPPEVDGEILVTAEGNGMVEGEKTSNAVEDLNPKGLESWLVLLVIMLGGVPYVLLRRRILPKR